MVTVLALYGGLCMIEPEPGFPRAEALEPEMPEIDSPVIGLPESHNITDEKPFEEKGLLEYGGSLPGDR